MKPARRIHPRALALALALTLGGPPALAQNQTDFTAVDQMLKKKDTDGAVKALQAIVKAEPGNKPAWVRLGGVLINVEGRAAEAAAAFEKALAIKEDFRTLYNAGCAYARAGAPDKAFPYLTRAVENGGFSPAVLEKDTDLASLRRDPRYAELKEKAARKSEPCRFQKESSEFDFWVGEWSVHPNGVDRQAGESRIEKILSGCVLLENWTGSNGWSGKSFNIFDQDRKRWHQTWVDQSGGITHFVDGVYENGAMRFRTEPKRDDKGVLAQRLLTFSNMSPDRVRQHSQLSTDGGRTWTDEYDFIYERKK